MFVIKLLTNIFVDSNKTKILIIYINQKKKYMKNNQEISKNQYAWR